MRPYGFSGSPPAAPAASSVQCSPPSVDLNRPLPGPPDRNVHAWRRKSHMAAKTVDGSCALEASIAQPVDWFAPASTLFHVVPPSVVRYTPPAALSFHRCPVAQARTVLPLRGSTMILAMCSESFSPTFVQFSPPS